MKRFLPTTVLTVVLTVFFIVPSFFLGTRLALAQTAGDAVPKPKVPCTATGDPEFNSLRPYQASPCGDTVYGLFCGNKINIVETKTDHTAGCVTSMHTDWTVDKDYWIDLSGTEFPILGNTELPQNSSNLTDKIDDTTKMNEYVSWYLNGVTNRAEYGDTKNTDNETVNLSGPIQKLLPQAISEATRIASIASASASGPASVDDDNPGPATEPPTHNQIVVCAQKRWPLIPAWLTNFFGLPSIGIGNETPVDCYPKVKAPAQGDVYRLTGDGFSWKGSSSAQDIINWAAQNFAKIYPGNVVAQVLAGAANRWPLKIPPLPWADQYGKPFVSEMLYQKAYNEWRGQLCAIIPNPLSGGDSLLCLGAWPLINNPYADLFPYVPLAKTPDKVGKMPINVVDIIPGSGTVMDSSNWIKLAAPSLYYAHTQEVKDLSVSLNQTYVPEGLDTSTIPSTSTESNDATSAPKCRILDVRSNPGDNLFPIKTPADIGVHVYFHVSQIDQCTCAPGPRGNMISTCHGEVDIGIHTDPVKVPYANEIWKSTVAGNASTFRKMYPKVEPGAPVTCIADIPSVTNATYVPVAGTDKIGVEGPLGSPNQANMDPLNAKIYFPHFGSVYDYFLKGIQTALRPKGYGEPTPESGTLCNSPVITTCDGRAFGALGPPGSTTAQASSFFQSDIKPKLTPDLINVYAQAEQATGVACEVLAGVHFEEADNNPGLDLQSGAPLGGRSLLDSAIQAGNEIKAKVGGKISSWDKAITALSRYNGGGNSNCGVASGYTGPCPPPEGIDDLYPLAWIDAAHLNMYLIYCTDGTKCPQPYPLVTRPGVLTVATELFNTEGK